MNKPFDGLNPNTTRGAQGNALAVANGARLAYSDAADVARSLEEWGFALDHAEFLDRNDSNGFATVFERMVLVSFRGTQSNDIWYWTADADVVLRLFPVGLVQKSQLGYSRIQHHSARPDGNQFGHIPGIHVN
jgi:hypothetical protein